jgi:Undecaprenyl-phosphate glucose phosphotransferase
MARDRHSKPDTQHEGHALKYRRITLAKPIKLGHSPSIMLRQHHQLFRGAQMLRDTLLNVAAFVVAYTLRYHTDFLPFTQAPNVAESILTGILLAVLWPLLGWISGLYVSHRTRSWVAETFDVLKVSLITLLALVTFTYFSRDERYSRSVLALWSAGSFFLVTGGRLVSRWLLRRARQKGFNLRHILVVGSGELARDVIKLITGNPAMGLYVSGVVTTGTNAEPRLGQHLDQTPVLGTIGDMPRILATKNEKNAIDQVLVALPIEKLTYLKEIMRVLSRETVDVRLIPDINQFITLCGSVEDFAGLPVINLQVTPLVGWSRFTKRAFDCGASFCALIGLSPLFAVIALTVRLGSRGPIFFKQTRVGLDGKSFDMFKFRTMVVDSEQAGPQMTKSQDPRCTPIGKYLRRLSLDELPQLLNVLLGDMSLVGPRPEQPAFIDVFKEEIPRYALRHKIKAGMTGWAQVNGLRGNSSIKKRIEMDLYYIENWSMGLDVKIIIRTLCGGFISPHAY